MAQLEATTDVGSVHRGAGAGGLLWHVTFEPALPAEIGAVTLSGPTDTAVPAPVRLPHWPPARYDAFAQTVKTAPRPGTPRHHEADRPLPDRVIALSADLGVTAGVHRAITSLYCWSSWFLMTIEATGDHLSVEPQVVSTHSWEMEDDRRNQYVGAWTGGWSGRDYGAHIAFTPGLDTQARSLQLFFTDPFGRTGDLTTIVEVPSRQPDR